MINEAAAKSAAHGEALMHERRQRDRPALPDFAQTLRVGNAHIGEKHFVEIRATRSLADRPDIDARRAHRKEEHRQALVLGRIGIGACEQQSVIREMRARGPDLLAIDDPVDAVLLGTRAQTRDVRAGGRFGEQLAPNLLAGKRGRDIARADVLRGIGHQRRNAHAQTDGKHTRVGHVEFRFFLIVDDLLNRSAAESTRFFRPRDSRVALRRLLCLPGFGPRHDVARLADLKGRLDG